MTMNAHVVRPDGCPACGFRGRRPAALLAASVAVASYLLGYACAERRHGRAVIEAGRRQFLEFLCVASDLGIVAVDRRKLDEAIIAGSEGAWEDREAMDAEDAARATAEEAEDRGQTNAGGTRTGP